MKRKTLCSIMLTLLFTLLMCEAAFATVVIRGSGRTYILDRTTARWDVTEAESLGFRPERFLYGIGKDAFVPLDDRYMTDAEQNIPEGLRVIGVLNNRAAQAYSIPRLSRHEISNSMIGDQPIAVAYCPLADLSAVYDRTIKDQTLTLVASGWIYNDTCVLYDRETFTLWYPYQKGLMAIQGKYFEQWLPLIKSEDTTWGKWRKKHRKSRILR